MSLLIPSSHISQILEEPGVKKYIMLNGEEVYEKNGKWYDKYYNHITENDVKGKIPNGLCGHPTCRAENSQWTDTSFIQPRFVCAACAAEKNSRAKRMFGQDVELPCIAPKTT